MIMNKKITSKVDFLSIFLRIMVFALLAILITIPLFLLLNMLGII